MKLNKPYTNKQYADLAVYCNKNGLIIEDKGDYLEAVNPPRKSLELVKAEKLAEIKQAFNKGQENGHCASSLGFEVDATRRSKDDIESLLYVDMFPVRFRDYNNEFHDLSKEQVEVLKKEIIAYGLSVYQKKWTLQQTVENATTVEEVEAVSW